MVSNFLINKHNYIQLHYYVLKINNALFHLKKNYTQEHIFASKEKIISINLFPIIIKHNSYCAKMNAAKRVPKKPTGYSINNFVKFQKYFP